MGSKVNAQAAVRARRDRKAVKVQTLTLAQRRELDRRLDDLERDPGAVMPWQEVLDRIRERIATSPSGRKRRQR